MRFVLSLRDADAYLSISEPSLSRLIPPRRSKPGRTARARSSMWLCSPRRPETTQHLLYRLGADVAPASRAGEQRFEFCWLGCVIDAVVVLSVVAVVVADNTYTPEQRPNAIGLAVVLGAIPLGIGRALRYILAGT
jgi:hypothetical protein